ncbi:MAG: fumarate hydratase [Candidatus Glassbacteria bacterium RIFCSPLOWO2_12_FULL_58_11]|uniref:Fumarate hydratase n=1 Tax=Candidatus Glassbacteria bacterium RIFCSPLOWO2_12_FULL_58_11 TaxID=1817867 RepID=A0A1F5YPR1_9BACT|nr:MAG: fumarate hydratase [Candidatus Glassbacteria bacterium RIFCSPLOWO2_12_FULL_58_11]
MKTVDLNEVTGRVADLCGKANCLLGEDVIAALEKARRAEQSPTGRKILDQILENARLARDKNAPLCQDTGFAVFFVELGTEVRLQGEGTLEEAINRGVARGYKENFLRKSIVRDPLNRVNTGDNTPAVVHLTQVPGDRLSLTFAPKGGGSENMSRLAMLKPADGLEGVKRFVIETVQIAGANPCPPIIVGLGIGATFEKCAWLAKKALLRPLGSRHPVAFYADLEEELLDLVNRTGVGPQGLGGTTTALGVLIETHPCHIASLPVALNMQCHSARHLTAVF